MIDTAELIFERCDKPSQDYWFKVTGETKDTLTSRYMEQSMVEVAEIVYSMSDGRLGIKRIFPWNFDVIEPDDNELRQALVAAIARQE